MGVDDEAALRCAADSGDAAAMFELAHRLEASGRQVLADSREWLLRAANAGSLDADLALVRVFVANGEYMSAEGQLRHIELSYPTVSAQRLVTIAPDVLGPRLSLEGDGFADDGDAVFTIISNQRNRAAVAVARVAERLMDVDEHGGIQTPEAVMQWDARDHQGDDPPYTPNYIGPVKICRYGAQVALDTKGCMWSAMGRMMVGILVDALVADRVCAHIAGHRPDLDTQWSEWRPRA